MYYIPSPCTYVKPEPWSPNPNPGHRTRTRPPPLPLPNPHQLRTINARLRDQIESDLVPEADDAEALKAYRNALENSMAAAAAAHPLENGQDSQVRFGFGFG